MWYTSCGCWLTSWIINEFEKVSQAFCYTKNRQLRLHVATAVAQFLVKSPHSPILHYAFSSWIEKTTTKTIHCRWKTDLFNNSMGLCGNLTQFFIALKRSRGCLMMLEGSVTKDLSHVQNRKPVASHTFMSILLLTGKMIQSLIKLQQIMIWTKTIIMMITVMIIIVILIIIYSY